MLIFLFGLFVFPAVVFITLVLLAVCLMELIRGITGK